MLGVERRGAVAQARVSLIKSHGEAFACSLSPKLSENMVTLHFRISLLEHWTG